MRVIDVDAHFHEPFDWIEFTAPNLAKELGPPLRFKEAANSIFGISNPKFKQLGEKQQPTGGYETVTPGMTAHLQMTDDRQPDEQKSMADDPYCGMPGRLKFCDEKGIDVQLLNPSFLSSAYIHAARVKRADLIPQIRQCWNTWASNLVEGHTERMIPVAQIDMSDVPSAVIEMTAMRKAGSRAFTIQAPVHQGKNELPKSISHPDFDPIWSAATDLGMAAIAHVGFGSERINPGWANNGGDNLFTYSNLNHFIRAQFAPQLLIGSMVLDGVFERHPKLALIIEEVGISWLPHLCEQLDAAAGRKGKMPRPTEDGEYRPVYEKSIYQLPLAPTEYMQQNVWVTNLAATEPLRPTIDSIPDNIVCFSSDYPHVEGTADAVAICNQQLEHLSDEARANFYNGAGKAMGL